MFERLLVAIDDTAAGEVGISFATALAHRYGASVHVFHVNELLIGGRGVTLETDRDASRLVDRAVQQLQDSGVEATGEYVVANCFTLAPHIAEAASRSGADAILLGSQRRRRLPRLFGRGVRERVTGVTPLPVLTAPSPLKLVGGRKGADAEVRRLAHSDESRLIA
jgi:nucleotide-binding universal stress UspA family protein